VYQHVCDGSNCADSTDDVREGAELTANAHYPRLTDMDDNTSASPAIDHYTISFFFWGGGAGN
jgi:hypothetical protein